MQNRLVSDDDSRLAAAEEARSARDDAVFPYLDAAAAVESGAEAIKFSEEYGFQTHGVTGRDKMSAYILQRLRCMVSAESACRQASCPQAPIEREVCWSCVMARTA